MDPFHVAASLRRIARKIDLSKRPQRAFVNESITRVIRAMDNDNTVEWLEMKVREYSPVSQDVPYPTIDGIFKFKLSDGRMCEFDGRFDENDQVGKFTCDGQDMTQELFKNGGDGADLGFLDENLEGEPLDFLIENQIRKSGS